LNVTANPSENDHRNKYWARYGAPGRAGSTVPVLKYRLNMRVMRRELDSALRDVSFPDRVDPERFDRVRQSAVDDCWRPFPLRTRDDVRDAALAEIRTIHGLAPSMGVGQP
jgi:hypothetical protein